MIGLPRIARWLRGAADSICPPGLGRWFLPYLLDHPRRRARHHTGTVHLILCIADHFEPSMGQPPASVAQERVDRWVRDYPRFLGPFRDTDGLPPRHTFFFPQDEYHPDHVDALAELCQAGWGEVEIHLHHDHDTAEGLRRKLLDFKGTLAERHGMLARDRVTGAVQYGFIHGNWALCNSRSDGRWCGVNDEIDVLVETGCYADFTMPSAPEATQTRTTNRIYRAVNVPGRPRSHDTGVEVGTLPAPLQSLLMVQGPLVLDWERRKLGVLPRLENGCIQANQPLAASRVQHWLRANIHVPGRPDWVFVKLHTHGAVERNADVLLGAPAVRFHEALARRAERDPMFCYHYVTAREMVNLIRAAEAGWQGSVRDVRDWMLTSEHAPACGLPRQQELVGGPISTPWENRP